MKLQWTRSEDYYTEEKSGRFCLDPKYNHGTKPFGYHLMDNGIHVKRFITTQREGKALAQRIVDKEK